MNEIVLSTLMPIIAAASMSWAVARMALPDLVLLDEIGEGDQQRERQPEDDEVRPGVADPADR